MEMQHATQIFVSCRQEEEGKEEEKSELTWWCHVSAIILSWVRNGTK